MLSSKTSSWVKTNIGSILVFLYGQALPERVRSGIGFPVYGSNGIVGYHDNPLTTGETIIIGRKGSIGEVSYSKTPCSPIDTTYYIDQFFGMPSKFWYYCLKQANLRDLNKATAVPGLNREDAYAVEVPLPPLNEQKRIADKLDALLARVDACGAHLEPVPGILKRFRQAVLSAATSGQLTKDWRIKSGLQNPENISDNSNSFDFYDTECFGSYQFPASWEISRLGKITDITSGITKDTKKQNPNDAEVPYLRVANVQRGFLDLRDIKTIRVPSDRILELRLLPGDILFNEGGDLDKLGRGWIWSGEIDPCVFQNHVFRARLRDPRYAPKFFSFYGNSRGYDYFLTYGKQTTNLASINKSLLEALPIVVPPPDEQHEIVRRVENLFALADRLEVRYNNAKALVDNLTSTLIVKAFRGELVPQDPNDEPASQLLDRIRLSKDSMLSQIEKPPRRKNMSTERISRDTPVTPDEIIKALHTAGKALTSKDLFFAVGYPDNSDSEKVEDFFIAIREALGKGVNRDREGNEDWFSLDEK